MKFFIKYYMLLVPFLCLSQKKENIIFFDDLKQLQLPFVIDENNFNEINTYREVTYGSIESMLISKDSTFSIREKNKKTKFYLYGKFELHGLTAVIMFNKNNETNGITCFMFLYDKNNLLSFEYIAGKNTINHTSETCYVDLNKIIEFSSENRSNPIYLQYVPDRNPQSFFPFSRYQCDEKEECINFKSSIDSIPQSSFKSYTFDKTFFEKAIDFVPLKYCSPYPGYAILRSVGNTHFPTYQSFFINSVTLEDGKKIVFFLNRFEGTDFKNVAEVGFQLLDNKGKPVRTSQIAVTYIHPGGTITTLKGSVFIKDKEVKIAYDDGYGKKTFTYRLE